MAEEFQRLGGKEADLVSRRTSDPAKLVLALRLRGEITLTVKAIGARIHLGTSRSASVCLEH